MTEIREKLDYIHGNNSQQYRKKKAIIHPDT